MRDINYVVKHFKTKYKEGFIDSEVETLLEEFDISKKQFNKKFGVNTVMMRDGNMIMYHCDVITTIRCIIENRELYSHEWD